MSGDAGKSPLFGRQVCVSRTGLGCLAVDSRHNIAVLKRPVYTWSIDPERARLFETSRSSMMVSAIEYLATFHSGDFDWVPADEVLGWIVKGWNIEKIKGMLGEDVLIEEGYWGGGNDPAWAGKDVAKVYHDNVWNSAGSLKRWGEKVAKRKDILYPKSHVAWVLAFLPKVSVSAGKSDVLIRDQSLCLCGTCSARRKKETA